MPFYHTHRLNEEIYLFLKGVGEFQIDGKVLPRSVKGRSSGSPRKESDAGGTLPKQKICIMSSSKPVQAPTKAIPSRTASAFRSE